MRIYVTEKDLREGEPCNPKECAIARAINRKIGANYYSSVASYWCEIIHKRIVLRKFFFFSERVRKLMGDIDSRDDVKPFSFTLPLENMQ